MTTDDIVLRHAQARDRQAGPFRQVFRVNLRDYWQGNLLGFDVVGFDDRVVCPLPGESTLDAIRRQWGDEGVRIIRDLVPADSE